MMINNSCCRSNRTYPTWREACKEAIWFLREWKRIMCVQKRPKRGDYRSEAMAW